MRFDAIALTSVVLAATLVHCRGDTFSASASDAGSTTDSGSATDAATQPGPDAATLPASCADARAHFGVLDDGDVTINPDGRGPTAPFSVYCYGMGDGALPSEYLTLARSGTAFPSSNFSEWAIGGSGCACAAADVRRVFSKVRIDASSLQLLVDDFTFAPASRAPTTCEVDNQSCQGFGATAYGWAGSCKASLDTSGRANVDLRGVPFALADGVTGRSVGNDANGTATISPDRKTADLTGGGLCGYEELGPPSTQAILPLKQAPP